MVRKETLHREDSEFRATVEMKTGKMKSTVAQRPVEVDAVGTTPRASKPEPSHDSARKKPNAATPSPEHDPMATFSQIDHIKKLSLKDYQRLEEQVKEYGNFHGYVCREDLPVMLTSKGDWLIRISIHPDGKKKKKKDKEKLSEKERKKMNCGRRQERPKANSSVLISVNCKAVDKPKTSSPTHVIRNLVISHHAGIYWIATSPKFHTLYELIDWASNTNVRVKDFEFRLRREILLQSWEFKHDDVVQLPTKLGEGAFGEVNAGRLYLTSNPKSVASVAVKVLKNVSTGVTREQIHELLHEARMMRILSHLNVLKVYGIAVLQQPPMLMTELCSLGALREYLKENKEKIGLQDKLKFVLGAARGVEYIHSQRMIHRDLAVRNIFLTKDGIPKVSDFGLARQSDRYEMKEQCKIPVRYLSPETLETYIFTPKTDVFSFGCVIWEIYENGKQPYDGMNVVSIRTQVKKREFLKLPSEAPMELRKVVSDKVFVADPENRCEMGMVVKTCEALLKES